MTTTARLLREAILDLGIKNVNYFNGRILTGDDLRDDQKAVRARGNLYGQAIGDGIAYGLEVSAVTGKSTPTVAISAGLAINRAGEVLHLPIDIPELALSVKADAVPDEAGLFNDCDLGGTSTPNVTAGALFLLTLSPASGYSGRAAVSGLNTTSTAGAACVSRYAVEGVSFNLYRLQPQQIVSPDSYYHDQLIARLSAAQDGAATEAVHLLRSLVAHLCFGTPEQWQFTHDPFRFEDDESVYSEWGALDRLRSLKLICDADVPLAIIYRVPSGISYVDNWSVRRRITAGLTSADWPMMDMQRRQIEGEAAFHQFQDQLEDIPASQRPEANALSYFYFLPPVGIVPLDLIDSGGTKTGELKRTGGVAGVGTAATEPLFGIGDSGEAKAIQSSAIGRRKTVRKFGKRSRVDAGSNFSERFFIDWTEPPNKLPYASQLQWLIHQSTHYPALDVQLNSERPFRELGLIHNVQQLNFLLAAGGYAQDRQFTAVFWLNAIPVQFASNEQYLRPKQ